MNGVEFIIWEEPFDYAPDEGEFIELMEDEDDIILGCCAYGLYGYLT